MVRRSLYDGEVFKNVDMPNISTNIVGIMAVYFGDVVRNIRIDKVIT